MMTHIQFLITAAIAGCVVGFTPHQTFQPATIVKGMNHWGMDGSNQQQQKQQQSKARKTTTTCRFLSSPGGEQPETNQSKKDSTSNTYYDDEVRIARSFDDTFRFWERRKEIL